MTIRLKYRVKKTRNGTWAVFKGSQYFKDTETDSKAEAQRMACVKSAQYYQSKMDDCCARWEEIGERHGLSTEDWFDMLS